MMHTEDRQKVYTTVHSLLVQGIWHRDLCTPAAISKTAGLNLLGISLFSCRGTLLLENITFGNRHSLYKSTAQSRNRNMIKFWRKASIENKQMQLFPHSSLEKTSPSLRPLS